MPNAIMIFAAGFGTRMGSLTATRPKPMIEVAGRPLIDHALSLAEGAGLSRMVVNVHYLPDQLINHLSSKNVAISDERDEILETGGGLRKALPLLGQGPVVTLNSDAVWTGPNPIDTLLRAWDPEKMDALLALVPKERAKGYTRPGNFLMQDDGGLTPGGGLVYTGCQIIRTEQFSTHPKTAFSMWEIWNQMFAKGRVYGAIHTGGWCDVGHPEGIEIAEELLTSNV
ncbi:MobA-like NTP transferase domain-containing protein [Aliiroseovarius crassostreae]|uniref:Nucleotidyltransferase n=1 Tax=Aliiroseovarius crassostreae TaxID=154981 RepID=A0A0P7JNL0_9RHOB|nr:nucleotidyltransferase family protein [Aliiroseovarius crassostreae]KPN62734.1 nucleotidyltransferase [Aliiroseovarius crassostreae]SFU88729.1 MobA-like NTP transferase domain-containing protein [Aliiroseovarius crassostreae]